MEVFPADADVSQASFEARCLAPNALGLVVSAVGRCEGWEGAKAWAAAEGEAGGDAGGRGSTVDTAALEAYLRAETDVDLEAEVAVVRCDESNESEECVQMRLSDFLALLDSGDRGDGSGNGSGVGHYLKDWHLQERVTGKPFYRPPALLGDDALNGYVHAGGTGFGDGSDYRFVYLGTAHTYTPFHTDVFGSYSWSLSVAGTKEWWFVPPAEMPKLGSEPPPHWLREARAAAGAAQAEGWTQLRVAFGDAEVEVLRFLQRPGDLVFVPSLWGHQVWNVTPCLSVNHNWCNRHNLRAMTGLLRSEAQYLERQLEDVRGLLEEQHAEEGGYAGRCEWLLHNAANWSVGAWVRLLAYAAEAGGARAAAVADACLDDLAGLPWGVDGLPAARERVRRVVSASQAA
eukprot:Rhum_TRINITY_DN15952_c0_g1::Rhum_TRINITY_DN15952_c0_g1_i1::g.162385::m.162385